MKSPIKPNGDTITQSDLEAILGAESALNALLFHLKLRLASGARIERGAYDVRVEEFALGRNINITEESEFVGSSGSYCGIEIGRRKNLGALKRAA